MRVIVERIKEGKVFVNGEKKGEIKRGLLVLAGICKGDTLEEISWCAKKIVNLRIFEDREGKINLSLKDIKGKVLIISNFTLCADIKKGNRPSFDKAESPNKAKDMLLFFKSEIERMGICVEEGEFGAFMEVFHINDGPFTLFIDTREKFKKEEKNET
jgi:D-tyrosyl-tRNA(Tyr) deacylase